MTKYYLIHLGLYLLAAAGLCLCDVYEPAWVTEKLRARLRPEAEQLIPTLNKIKSHLKLRDYAGADEIFQRIEDIRKDKGFDWKTCIGSESKKRLTLDRLISLRSLARQCELHSLEELELFYLAAQESRPFNVFIYKIVKIFRIEHALTCGPIYKRIYHDRLIMENLNDEQRRNYELVHASLDGLNYMDFDKIMRDAEWCSIAAKWQLMIMMRDFDIMTQASNGLYHIVISIGSRLIKLGSKWASLMKRDFDSAQLKLALDEYLFEPCSGFRRTLEPLIEPALIVATYDTLEQLKFIAEDERFFRDMFNYALCGKLLDKRDQLVDELSTIWSKCSPHQFVRYDWTE